MIAGSTLAYSQHDLLDADTAIAFYKKSKTRFTEEFAFIEGHFIRADSTPHVNEEIILTYLSRHKSKSYYTDSAGRIDFRLPPGEWAIYARRLGVVKKLAHFTVADYYVGHDKK